MAEYATPQGFASKRYSSMTTDRDPYLQRARRNAGLTISSLFRDTGANGSTDTALAWTSFGGYCVNNLTAKLTLTMFPPGIPFIRLNMTPKASADLKDLPEDQRGELKTEIAKGLAMAETEFVVGVDEDGDIDRLGVAIRHNIVAGNHCIQMYPHGAIRGISLDHFVTLRDKAGNLLEFCIEDNLVYETLPEDVQKLCQDHGYKKSTGPENKPAASVALYTHGCLNGGKWKVYQECFGQTVPNTEWQYNPDALPFIFITMNLLDGEHYARSYVEDYEADLQTLDGMEQVVQEGSAAAAMMIRMVRPGGVTSKAVLEKAQNGAIITGDITDVATLDSGKNTDFQIAEKRIIAKEDRLSKAFLLNSSVQRSGERVTAEEIRYVADELNKALGGVYSAQVTSFQKPYSLLKMAALQRTKRMVYLPKGTVKPMIVTGAAALGRNAELTALDSLVTLPPTMQEAAGVVDKSIYMRRRATALGIDQEGLIKSAEAMQAEQQQAQQLAFAQTATPDTIKGATSLIGNMQKNQGSQDIEAMKQAATLNQPAQ